jgi:hypothetical protein
MAPVAEPKRSEQTAKQNGTKASFNPFYSPPIAVDFSDGYEYNKYRVRCSMDNVELTADSCAAILPQT